MRPLVEVGRSRGQVLLEGDLAVRGGDAGAEHGGGGGEGGGPAVLLPLLPSLPPSPLTEGRHSHLSLPVQ